MDIHVIAERVAEVVNRKLAAIDRRLTELESRVKRLELDVASVRGQVIESVVRSVLTIKVEELASAVALRVATEFGGVARGVEGAVEELRGVAERLGRVAEGLEELRGLPERVAEELRSARVTAEVDTSVIEERVWDAVAGAMGDLRDLPKRLEAVERRLGEVSEAIRKVGESMAAVAAAASRLEEVARVVAEVKDSVDYVREVSSMLEERLRRAEAEEGDEG